MSSAYQLCSQIIQERYDPSRWNIYPFHFSDGENCAPGGMNTQQQSDHPLGGRFAVYA